MRTIDVKDFKTLKMLEDNSALTLEGLNKEDAHHFMEWVKNITPVTDEVVYIIKGKTMNLAYGLTGDNAYPNDLTIQAIPLNLVKNFAALVIPRFNIGARWFDDIVANNARRKGGDN